MENNFLLTYTDLNVYNIKTYKWFESEEELINFTQNWFVSVNEAIEIVSSRKINIR